MATTHKPRAGSLAYTPRKRAKKETPRMHSWTDTGEAKPLGFAGYKAGMTHVSAQDNNKNTPTAGMQTNMPVTVVAAPPMKVAGIRVYVKGYGGKKILKDVWAKEQSKELARKLSTKQEEDPQKALDEMKNREDIVDIMLIAHTQPKNNSTPKKTPDIMEIALGGPLEEKIEYAKNTLGKEISASDVFSNNQHVDATAVTKGKGYQGIIKRWGVRLQSRKAAKGRRHMGSGGAWTPARKLWREPQAGQMGYHTRTEYNKILLDIGEDGKTVTPSGGFLRYGPADGAYILLAGSVPGPTKRLIRLSTPRRPKEAPEYEILRVSTKSKQGA